MPISYDSNKRQLDFQGAFLFDHLGELLPVLNQYAKNNSRIETIHGECVTHLDTAIAYVLIDFSRKIQVKLTGFSPAHQQLLDFIEHHFERLQSSPAQPETETGFFYGLGKKTVEAMEMLFSFFQFLGQISCEWKRLITSSTPFRWTSLAAHIHYTGTCALPIVALLSIMVGIVITYQMGLQLKNYGANIFIVDLLGLSIFREFSPLLTAIMVAGRTGSSFTAELGIMRMNEEVDALNTMGITAEESLFLPRLFALTISLPLLTMWANVFGIVGGMLMSSNMLSVTWYDFLSRFQSVIPLRALLIGMGKAPVFALIIASVSCHLGSMVKGSADSIGKNTTRSVVLSIFCIILADAVFSILFSHFQL